MSEQSGGQVWMRRRRLGGRADTRRVLCDRASRSGSRDRMRERRRAAFEFQAASLFNSLPTSLHPDCDSTASKPDVIVCNVNCQTQRGFFIVHVA